VIDSMCCFSFLVREIFSISGNGSFFMKLKNFVYFFSRETFVVFRSGIVPDLSNSFIM